MIRKLDPTEAHERLSALPHWSFDEARGAIRREFVFADFAMAFAFMTRIALAAEKVDHHPEWSNIYNRVDMRLCSHDCLGLSQRDIDMARIADAAFVSMQGAN
jgi:4a-hydroxytetrahydrobiopterin dehydratase